MMISSCHQGTGNCRLMIFKTPYLYFALWDRCSDTLWHKVTESRNSYIFNCFINSLSCEIKIDRLPRCNDTSSEFVKEIKHSIRRCYLTKRVNSYSLTLTFWIWSATMQHRTFQLININGLTISLICTIVPAKLSGKIDFTRSILLGLIVPIGWTKSQVPFLSIAPAVLLFEKSWHVRPTKLSSISLIVNVSRHHWPTLKSWDAKAQKYYQEPQVAPV